mmetsp:Transcript_118810/g.206916  ORF Transcript_118810/g.206916 Transcript_118810/m.206916 type:complete len:280 (+) Transcript_118810:3-842(+)
MLKVARIAQLFNQISTELEAQVGILGVELFRGSGQRALVLGLQHDVNDLDNLTAVDVLGNDVTNGRIDLRVATTHSCRNHLNLFGFLFGFGLRTSDSGHAPVWVGQRHHLVGLALPEPHTRQSQNRRQQPSTETLVQATSSGKGRSNFNTLVDHDVRLGHGGELSLCHTTEALLLDRHISCGHDGLGLNGDVVLSRNAGCGSQSKCGGADDAGTCKQHGLGVGLCRGLGRELHSVVRPRHQRGRRVPIHVARKKIHTTCDAFQCTTRECFPHHVANHQS